jgi:hypothetical protein
LRGANVDDGERCPAASAIASRTISGAGLARPGHRAVLDATGEPGLIEPRLRAVHAIRRVRVCRDGRKTLAWRARSSRPAAWKLAGELTSIAYIARSLWLTALA